MRIISPREGYVSSEFARREQRHWRATARLAWAHDRRAVGVNWDSNFELFVKNRPVGRQLLGKRILFELDGEPVGAGVPPIRRYIVRYPETITRGHLSHALLPRSPRSHLIYIATDAFQLSDNDVYDPSERSINFIEKIVCDQTIHYYYCYHY